MKKFLLLTLVLVAAISLVGCKKKPKYQGLDKEAAGDISIMLWSGDGTDMMDIGHKDLKPEDIGGANQAQLYAVAKAFNQIYPNVTINVYAKVGDPDGGGVSWDQERENFKARFGKYPDIWASRYLSEEVAKGLVADLSMFSDDPMYQSFNPEIMSMMNYYGFQAGLPQFLQPWGVYINKSLANANFIDVPEPNWDLDDYTEFMQQADRDDFYGAMDVDLSFIMTGTKTLTYQLKNRQPGEPYVNMNSDEVIDLLDYVNDWADYALWPQNDLKRVKEGFHTEWWEWPMFRDNKLLTLSGQPWFMGDAASPNPEHVNKVKFEEWDIYPRPATPYVGNTVGVVLDPLAINNYCGEDGSFECTEAEFAKTKLAYTFASFWIGDTRAWQARADQQFSEGGILKDAMNDSLPLVTGDKFDEQMEIWYQADIHQRFKDTTKMPGWQKVLELWEAGQVWDVSDKAYPMYHDNFGERRHNFYEWQNIHLKDVAGAVRTDPNWLEQVKAKLPQWNEDMNARFEQSFESLKTGLRTYYGFTDEKFQ